jgi:hypothetical protein
MIRSLHGQLAIIHGWGGGGEGGGKRKKMVFHIAEFHPERLAQGNALCCRKPTKEWNGKEKKIIKNWVCTCPGINLEEKGGGRNSQSQWIPSAPAELPLSFPLR